MLSQRKAYAIIMVTGRGTGMYQAVNQSVGSAVFYVPVGL